jgi:antitoxin (DNA-binding transcriptional repressor) of toxin-antitoxin stability system
MDRLEAGESFTITRDGRAVGQLTPLRGPQEGVPLEHFTAAFAHIRPLDSKQLRAEMDEFFGDGGDRID